MAGYHDGGQDGKTSGGHGVAPDSASSGLPADHRTAPRTCISQVTGANLAPVFATAVRRHPVRFTKCRHQGQDRRQPPDSRGIRVLGQAWLVLPGHRTVGPPACQLPRQVRQHIDRAGAECEQAALSTINGIHAMAAPVTTLVGTCAKPDSEPGAAVRCDRSDQGEARLLRCSEGAAP